MDEKKQKWRRCSSSSGGDSHVNNLDDGCLMHIFSFLSPIPGAVNSCRGEIIENLNGFDVSLPVSHSL
ncbi:hypothetical protein Tco_0569424 [Tanacetum coccineum]